MSPLQQYLALRDDSLRVKVTGTTTRPGGVLRMATLTHFDGTYWTVSGDFRLAGKRLPRPPAAGHPVSVTTRVRVESGDPDWVLSAGRPTRLTVGGLGVDEATGDVAVPAGQGTPAAYDVTSAVNQVGVGALRDAEPSPARDRLPRRCPSRSAASWNVRSPGRRRPRTGSSRSTGGSLLRATSTTTMPRTSRAGTATTRSSGSWSSVAARASSTPARTRCWRAGSAWTAGW